MRTTLTLEPDIARKLKKNMALKGLTMKEAINRALRIGLEPGAGAARPSFKVEPHPFEFKPGIDLDKLNQLADELEAEEFARKFPR